MFVCVFVWKICPSHMKEKVTIPTFLIPQKSWRNMQGCIMKTPLNWFTKHCFVVQSLKLSKCCLLTTTHPQWKYFTPSSLLKNPQTTHCALHAHVKLLSIRTPLKQLSLGDAVGIVWDQPMANNKSTPIIVWNRVWLALFVAEGHRLMHSLACFKVKTHFPRVSKKTDLEGKVI